MRKFIKKLTQADITQKFSKRTINSCQNCTQLCKTMNHELHWMAF